jgi:GR25 family glycosyltransferase involved in LPS biosynthesis
MRYIVRCVPERMDFVREMQKAIPQLEICEDRSRNSMTTFLDSLILAGNDPVVHLEDDVILCDRFVGRIEEAIAGHKNEVIQFFSMRKADLTIGSRYIAGSKFMMNQCVYLPEGYSRMILRYAYTIGRERIRKDPTGYDLLMAECFQRYKLKYWNHCPSLVEHRIAKSMINPRRSSKRQSLTFAR